MCIYNVVANATDSENDSLSYFWEYENISGNWTPFGSNSPTATTPDFNTVGDINIRCTINDGANSSVVSNTLTVTVISDSNSFEVGLGDCDTLPISWTTVYSLDNIPLPDGAELFTDSARTNPYDGGDSSHRSRPLGGTSAARKFDVSPLGVVSKTFTCITVGDPENIQINEEQEDLSDGGCTTCANITINVPDGESRQVEFVKSGIGPYGSPGALCTDTGIGVVADNIYNISTNTTFDFGVDAARGNSGTNTATTTITVIVRDGATQLETYQLSRTHRDPVANC